MQINQIIYNYSQMCLKKQVKDLIGITKHGLFEIYFQYINSATF